MGVKEAREHVLRERHITNTEKWKVPPNLSSTRNITRGKTFTRNNAQPSFWKTSRTPMLTGHICGTVQLEPVLLDAVQKQQEYPRRHCVPSILSIMSKRLLVVNVLGSVLGRSDSLTIQEEQFLARKERGGGQGEKKEWVWDKRKEEELERGAENRQWNLTNTKGFLFWIRSLLLS